MRCACWSERISHLSNRIQSRIPGIDLVEVIGIFLVLLYHCDANPAIASCCVPLFFMANGYLLLNKPFDLQKHLRKTGRLCLLILVWSVGKILLLMAMRGKLLPLFQILEIMETLKVGWINSLWFLFALAQVYIVFPLMKLAFDREEKSFLAFAGIVAFLAFVPKTLMHLANILLALLRHRYVFLPGMGVFRWLQPYSGNGGFALAYFCIGGMLCRWQDRIAAVPARKRNGLAAAALLVSLACQEMVNYFYRTTGYLSWDGVFEGYDMLPILVSTVCIFVLAMNFRRDCKWIRLISENTFGIYLLHDLFLIVLNEVLKGVPIPFWLLVPVMLLLSGSLSLGLTLLLKKNQVTRKLFL